MRECRKFHVDSIGRTKGTFIVFSNFMYSEPVMDDHYPQNAQKLFIQCIPPTHFHLNKEVLNISFQLQSLRENIPPFRLVDAFRLDRNR